MCEDSNDRDTNARSQCSHLCGLMIFFLEIVLDMTSDSASSSTLFASFASRANDSEACVSMCFLRLLECIKPKRKCFQLTRGRLTTNCQLLRNIPAPQKAQLKLIITFASLGLRCCDIGLDGDFFN